MLRSYQTSTGDAKEGVKGEGESVIFYIMLLTGMGAGAWAFVEELRYQL